MDFEKTMYRNVSINTEENNEGLLNEKQVAALNGIRLVFLETVDFSEAGNEAMMLSARVRHLNMVE